MTPWLDDGDVRLYHGDCLDVLRGLPDGCVHMCATSPPFYGLRDYGVDGQIGLEESPDEWVARLVAVFREVRRVLRDDGTLWVEIGDSYVSGQGGRQSAVGEMPARALALDSAGDVGRSDVDAGSWRSGATSKMTPARGETDLKPKDLLGQPWMLAFALRADGWYLRSEIIWADADAIREPYSEGSYTASKAANFMGVKAQDARGRGENGDGSKPRNVPRAGKSAPQAETLDGSDGEAPRGPDGRRQTTVQKGDNSEQHRDGERWPNPTGANARSVWTIEYEGECETGQDTTEWIAQLGSCRKCGGLRVVGNGSEVTIATGTGASGDREKSRPTDSVTSTTSGQSQTDTPSTTFAETKAASAPTTSNQSPQESTSSEATHPHHETPQRNAATTGIRSPLRTLIDALTAAESAGNVCVCDDAPTSPGDVWRIATEPTQFAHFATWPQKLVARMVKAGTSEKGCCPECGASWEREISQEPNLHPGASGRTSAQGDVQRGKREDGKAIGTIMRERHQAGRHRATLGWQPSCDHGGHQPVPCTILDPFAGSGTTLKVARDHARHAIGIELNEDYCRIAADRLAQQSLLTGDAP